MYQTTVLVYGFGMVKNTNEVSSQLYLAAFPATKYFTRVNVLFEVGQNALNICLLHTEEPNSRLFFHFYMYKLIIQLLNPHFIDQYAIRSKLIKFNICQHPLRCSVCCLILPSVIIVPRCYIVHISLYSN